MGDASRGAFWPWSVLGNGALAVLRPVPCDGAKDGAVLRVAGTYPLACVVKRGVFLVRECASAVVARPGLVRQRVGFWRSPGLAVAQMVRRAFSAREAPANWESTSSSGRGVFVWRWSESDAQPRVQPTRLSAVGKWARFWELGYTENVLKSQRRRAADAHVGWPNRAIEGL